MSKFLTNREESLQYILKEISASEPQEIKILTGYFYFSGLKELPFLQNEKIRILIGMEAEPGTGGVIREYAEYGNWGKDGEGVSLQSKDKTRQAFY